mmetsp:Transcript_12103/g.37336  ORF Transcript_12103/g.37336 Transcript_12103/m.37336 type:complete len:220 (+) Transcript_12103:222-881(+)
MARGRSEEGGTERGKGGGEAEGSTCESRIPRDLLLPLTPRRDEVADTSHDAADGLDHAPAGRGRRVLGIDSRRGGAAVRPGARRRLGAAAAKAERAQHAAAAIIDLQYIWLLLLGRRLLCVGWVGQDGGAGEDGAKVKGHTRQLLSGDLRLGLEYLAIGKVAWAATGLGLVNRCSATGAARAPRVCELDARQRARRGACGVGRAAVPRAHVADERAARG